MNRIDGDSEPLFAASDSLPATALEDPAASVLASLAKLRGLAYAALSVLMVGWWIIAGLGSAFGAPRVPWWSLIPASVALSGSLWSHRLLRSGFSRHFLLIVLAIEIMLWTAVASLGFRAGFLLFGLAQVGGFVLVLWPIWMEAQFARAQGFLDEELVLMSAEYAMVFTISSSAAAIIIGGISVG